MTMPGRRSAILGGMAGAALALAACGGDSGDGGPTRGSYIAEADRACAGFRPAFTKLSEDIRESAPLMRKDLVARRRVYREVSRLEAPSALRPKVDEFLAASRVFLDRLDEQARLAAAGDYQVYQEQDASVGQAGARRGRLAAEVGYKRCGQPLGGPALTPAGFLPVAVGARADAGCKRATDVAVATRPSGTKPSDIVATYTTVAPASRSAYRQLAAIDVPAANRKDWDAFLDVFDRRVTAIETIRDGGKATSEPGLFDREVALTRRLGLTVCGQSTSLGV
jgi:hypothetical protein